MLFCFNSHASHFSDVLSFSVTCRKADSDTQVENHLLQSCTRVKTHFTMENISTQQTLESMWK